MNVSIRVKFFVFLIAFSLGPMMLTRFFMGKEAGDTAREISQHTREEMVEIINAELEDSAVSLLQYLDARGQAFTIGLQLMAQQVEHVLYWQRPQHNEKTYLTSNYRPGGDNPPDLVESPNYRRKVRSGQTRPQQVSVGSAAFHLPMDRAVNDVDETLYRLNGTLPIIKSIHREHGYGPYWYNIGLKSGPFMTYPGHGNFPMHWSHLDQTWYIEARQAKDKPVWTMPAIDPATRFAVTTNSLAIHDPEGNFVGAVGIDVPISHLLDEVSPKSRWSDQIQSFMVKLFPGDTPEGGYLLILAQHSYDNTRHRSWMTGIEAEYMVADNGESTARLIQAMTESQSGIIRLPYNGENSVWAFASNEDFSFLMILPENVADHLPNEVAGTVEYLFQAMRHISTLVSGIVFIIIGLIAWFGSKAVTRPLLSMADAAKRLASGDLTARINMKTGDERDQLIEAFNDVGPKLQEHMQLRRDMELAHQVQQLLLPRTTPDLNGYDISGGIKFCDETGGDYYDFIDMQQKGQKCLGVVLGDVSGHGVPSALVMATARGQLHSLSKAPLTPRRRIQAINTVLSRDLDGTGRFLTLFYLRLCEMDAKVKWVRAGHDPAIRYTPDKDEFSELCGDGLALGVLEEFEFQDYETTLESGEILVIATDGVWEAHSQDGEMFGKQRMLAIIREKAQNCADDIRKAIVQAVESFQGNGQEDDIAIVVIKRK